MTCPADHDLSLHADGELTTNQARALDAHLAGCSACRARHQQLRALAGAVAAAYAAPAAEPAFTREVMARTAPAPRRVGPLLAIRLGLVGATVVLAVVLVVFQTTPPGSAEDPRTRGTFAARSGSEAALVGPPSARNVGFAAFRGTSQAPPLADGDTISPTTGFTFRAFNRSGRPVSMMLLALDARGEVHWFYPAFLDPASNPTSRVLGADPVVLDLEDGVTPDRPAPGQLTLIGLFAEAPLDVRTVEAELAAGGVAALTAPVVHTLALEVTR